MNRALIAIATVLFLGCTTTPVTSPAEVITGYTVEMGPACVVSDLSTESMDLISLWWSLNKKRADGTITDEEYAQGSVIEQSGKCGLLLGGTPVTIALSDGTIYLLRFPDGVLMGVTSDSFTEKAPAPKGKTFKVDED